jgi:hypothetical protein
MVKPLAMAILVLLAPSSPGGKEKDKHTIRFGGLIITVTAIGRAEDMVKKVSVPPESLNPLEQGRVPAPPVTPPPPAPVPDHHYVAVFVNVKNVGKSAACMSFLPLLKATLGLEYKGSFRTQAADKIFPSAPRISEMLPGEESSGSYVFIVKNGASPLEMFLKPEGKSTHCNESPTGNWGDTLLPQALNFDVHDLPGPNSVPSHN